MPEPAARTVVYTDGACLGNPGPGGWAWAVPGGAFASGADNPTTNQRMEITAALEAVRALAGPLEVVSDSTYVVNCFRDRWWEGWRQRGWLNSQRKPVANRDLWEPLVDLVEARGDVAFRWVKGHSGDAMNDLVDLLAVEAANTQQARSGAEPPTSFAPGTAADAFGAAEAGRDARLPAGWLLGVFGHRPAELGGYDPNPTADRVKARLAAIVAATRELHDDLVVVSGLRLGAEMLGAEAALEVGVPLVAVLPYPEPDAVWSAASRAAFADLVAGADGVITLERKSPDSKQRAGAALARRDAWLARNVDQALVVWDGEDDAIGKLVRSLQDRLGDEVWIEPPPEPLSGRDAGGARGTRG